ncbi:MAG: hypothetical protein JRJ85_26780 [Deltaproteobacteria bacterium]|nr:hypothetical protein [Deltaproteobacteria bacterium]
MRQGFIIVTFKAAMVEGGILKEGTQKGVQKSTQKSIQKTSDLILAILAKNSSEEYAGWWWHMAAIRIFS